MKTRYFVALLTLSSLLFLHSMRSNSNAEVTAIKPKRVDPALQTELSSSDFSSSGKKSGTHSTHKIQNFKGIGIRNGSFDTGFAKKEGRSGKGVITMPTQSTIKLSPGMQRFVDGAGKTIKQINQKALDVVKKPFSWVGLEAESAKLRPANGGVGLGVSIKLDKRKKTNSADIKPSASNSQEFYDLIKPSETSKTY